MYIKLKAQRREMNPHVDFFIFRSLFFCLIVPRC